jgi:hypothetical protein
LIETPAYGLVIFTPWIVPSLTRYQRVGCVEKTGVEPNSLVLRIRIVRRSANSLKGFSMSSS